MPLFSGTNWADDVGIRGLTAPIKAGRSLVPAGEAPDGYRLGKHGRSFRTETRPEFRSPAFRWCETRTCDGTNQGCTTAVDKTHRDTLINSYSREYEIHTHESINSYSRENAQRHTKKIILAHCGYVEMDFLEQTQRQDRLGPVLSRDVC